MSLFNPDYAPLEVGNLLMPAGTSGAYRVLITDLYPNTNYNLALGNTQVSQVASEAGTIYLENVTLNSNDIITVSRTGNIPTLAIVTTTLPDARVGSPYLQTLRAANGIQPYTWTLTSGQLPEGLNLIGDIISGIPVREDTSELTIQVTDHASPPNSFSTALSIVVRIDSLTGIAGGSPTEFSLEQNFPNPFNPSTTIRYSLARDSHVQIKIFDQLGRQVRLLLDEQRPAGVSQLIWNGTDDQGRRVASGTYFYRMTYGDGHQRLMKKMLLLR